MYEIWLATNIVWEYLLLHWPPFALYAVLLLIVWGIALRKQGRTILLIASPGGQYDRSLERLAPDRGFAHALERHTGRDPKTAGDLVPGARQEHLAPGLAGLVQDTLERSGVIRGPVRLHAGETRGWGCRGWCVGVRRPSRVNDEERPGCQRGHADECEIRGGCRDALGSVCHTAQNLPRCNRKARHFQARRAGDRDWSETDGPVRTLRRARKRLSALPSCFARPSFSPVLLTRKETREVIRAS